MVECRRPAYPKKKRYVCARCYRDSRRTGRPNLPRGAELRLPAATTPRRTRVRTRQPVAEEEPEEGQEEERYEGREEEREEEQEEEFPEPEAGRSEPGRRRRMSEEEEEEAPPASPQRTEDREPPANLDLLPEESEEPAAAVPLSLRFVDPETGERYTITASRYRLSKS